MAYILGTVGARGALDVELAWAACFQARLTSVALAISIVTLWVTDVDIILFGVYGEGIDSGATAIALGAWFGADA